MFNSKKEVLLFVLANWREPCEVDAVLELMQKFRSGMPFVVSVFAGTNFPKCGFDVKVRQVRKWYAMRCLNLTVCGRMRDR